MQAQLAEHVLRAHRGPIRASKGGAGNDVIGGGQGIDTCSGGPGTDTIGGCEN